ncbi:hypothetical protein KFE25_011448 [Diacronema lutheri]|uniref:Uncharacterized protein n=1 Tax=Diacronema lutheri TaxID=2081491 RepID=A0A8J6CAP0_DIALT|nr:hypothetical protein KFE25_011448 [Diacronema lutheri]
MATRPMVEGQRVVKRRRPAGNRGAKRVRTLLRDALHALPAELREDIETPTTAWEDTPEPASLMPPPEPPRAVGERVRLDGADAEVLKVSSKDAHKLKVRLRGTTRKLWVLDTQLDPPEAGALARLWGAGTDGADVAIAADRTATASVLRGLGVEWSPAHGVDTGGAASAGSARAPPPPPPPGAPAARESPGSPPREPARRGVEREAVGTAEHVSDVQAGTPAADGTRPRPSRAPSGGAVRAGAAAGGAVDAGLNVGVCAEHLSDVVGAPLAGAAADGAVRADAQPSQRAGGGAGERAAAAGAAGSLRSLFMQPATFTLFGSTGDDAQSPRVAPPSPAHLTPGDSAAAPTARVPAAAELAAAHAAVRASKPLGAAAGLQPLLFMRTQPEAELTDAWRERRQQGFKDFKSKHKTDVRQARKRKRQLALRGSRGRGGAHPARAQR